MDGFIEYLNDDLEAGGLVLLILFLCLVAFLVWVQRGIKRDVRDENRWIERRLQKAHWVVEHGVRRLDSLDLPFGSVRQYPGWSQAYLLAISRTNQRTTWLFRLRTPDLMFPLRFVRIMSDMDDVVACVVQSSRLDFPRVTVKNRRHHAGSILFTRKLSLRVGRQFPDSTRNWVACTEDEGERTLSLLSDLENALKRVMFVQTVEFDTDHLAIIGMRAREREGLFQFFGEVCRLLEAIGESDPFNGAFGSSESKNEFPRHHT
ncbi:hypothetical protein ACFL5Q_08010 [Planctomycetota bacterium]